MLILVFRNRTDNLDQAMSHLRDFAAKYPPQQVRTPQQKPDFRSTRTSLVGARPLVRMASVTEVPDDYVPPLITFRNVEILHHRLVDYSRKADIGYVMWLSKAYEWALRVRRDEAVRAKPAKIKEEAPAPFVERISAVLNNATREGKISPSGIDLDELLHEAHVPVPDAAALTDQWTELDEGDHTGL